MYISKAAWVHFFLTFAPSQVLPDYHGAAKRYEELGMHHQLDEERRVWADRARRWLRKRQLTEAEGDGAGKKQKKMHRAKSYHGVLAWDNGFQHSLGKGLADFCLPKALADRGDPFSWPRINQAADQGSDNICGGNYLIYNQNCNLVRSWDLSHGVWRDFALTVKRSSQWAFFLVMTCCQNAFHGPWSEDRFYETVRSAVDEMFVVCNPEADPLFSYYLPAILKDRGEVHRQGDTDICKEVWQDSPGEPWFHYTEHVLGLCCFYVQWLLSVAFAGAARMHWGRMLLLACFHSVASHAPRRHTVSLSLLQFHLSMHGSSYHFLVQVYSPAVGTCI